MQKELSILYLEDDKNNMIMMEKLFNTISCEFPMKLDYATNGKDGLNLYNKNRYDIIFTDIKMPIMGGVEFIGHINKLNENQIIVVVSAYDYSELNLADDLKISKYLNKPIRINKIYNIIRDYYLQ